MLDKLQAHHVKIRAQLARQHAQREEALAQKLEHKLEKVATRLERKIKNKPAAASVSQAFKKRLKGKRARAILKRWNKRDDD